MMTGIHEKHQETPHGWPEWIVSTFTPKDGRDPLGLQSITTDRVMPRLVPAILALSRRARYLSFYPFLLAEMHEERPYASQEELSTLVKRREYEYALAVQLCPRGCGRGGSDAIGLRKAGPKARSGVKEFDRDESVESYLGGYGLYYRSPLVDLGLIAPRGEIVPGLGEALPRDMVRPGPAHDLGNHYREAIGDTRYYRDYFRGAQPIPRMVLEELAEHACLCRLDDYPVERAAILEAILGLPSRRGDATLTTAGLEAAAHQRRLSFALVLWAVDQEPGLPPTGDSTRPFRRAVWEEFTDRVGERSRAGASPRFHLALGQWAGLVAKDYAQDALDCIWSEFCRRGLVTQPPDGMRPEDVEHFVRQQLLPGGPVAPAGAPFSLDPNRPTTRVLTELSDLLLGVPLEEVREWAIGESTATSGLVLLLALRTRLVDEVIADPAWRGVAREGSNWQPGLLKLVTELDQHLEGEPTLRDTLAWMTERFVVDVHERVAYSKLPDFTFRFRWEEERLRFYGQSPDRFGAGDIRVQTMTRLSADLGLIDQDDAGAVLTPAGRSLLTEVLG